MDKKRLLWHCRRGMLELDLLLLGFVKRDYDQLTASEQKTFQTMLGYPDPYLLDVLMEDAAPESAEIADIVQRVRATAKAQAEAV